MPYHQTDFHKAKPIYEELPGWQEDITGVTKASDLPKKHKTMSVLSKNTLAYPSL